MASEMTPRYLRVNEIATTQGTTGKRGRRSTRFGLLPISVSTWWAWVAAGKAPAPIKLSPGVTVWDRDEVLAFIQAGKQADGISPQPMPGHIPGAAHSFTDVADAMAARGEA